jgi:hypothetical protein
MFTPPRSVLAADAQPAPKWRSRVVWAGIWLAVVGGCLVSLRLTAIAWVRDSIYEKCLTDLPGATPDKCDCLARQWADRMVSYDYLKRIFRDESFSDEEFRDMRRSCDV